VTTDQWLKMLRRKLNDVDTAAQRRTDAQLLASADDLRLELAVRAVGGFSDITVGLNKQDASTYGIQNADDAQMLILVYAVAHSVLSSTYRERVDRGELGISWRSGLEEESTISAEKAYKTMLDELHASLDQLLVVYQRTTANGRKH
jgi:hypothetical protein